MAIRLLMTTDSVGGVWTYALDLASGLAARGVETTLAVLGPAPDSAQCAQAAGIAGLDLLETGLPLDWLSTEGEARWAAAALALLAERIGADIVQLNSPSLAAAADWPVPRIGVVHGCVAAWWQSARPGQALADDLAWHRAMMAEGLAACARVVAPSAAFAETIAALYGLPQRPQVVRNGRRWPLERQSPAPAPLAFTAGRLWDEVKQTPLLDRVAARLSVPFEAAGPVSGPQGQGSAPGHLKALGPLAPADLSGRLARRPVFVSAASFEPFGLAVLEAAQHGCALVLSDIPTFRELWDGAALFAPPADDAAFAAAVEGLLADPARRLAMGEGARTRAAGYSVAAMAGHYRAVLGRPVRPAPLAMAAA
jgi:glycosyltransferase involved in cell wall biosynthesis